MQDTLYTKDDFKNDLLIFLSKQPYDAEKIGKFAYHLYIKHIRKVDDDFSEEILNVAVMESGPEFEMTEQEFRDFLDKL